MVNFMGSELYINKAVIEKKRNHYKVAGPLTVPPPQIPSGYQGQLIRTPC